MLATTRRTDKVELRDQRAAPEAMPEGDTRRPALLTLIAASEARLEALSTCQSASKFGPPDDALSAQLTRVLEV